MTTVYRVVRENPDHRQLRHEIRLVQDDARISDGDKRAQIQRLVSAGSQKLGGVLHDDSSTTKNPCHTSPPTLLRNIFCDNMSNNSSICQECQIDDTAAGTVTASSPMLSCRRKCIILETSTTQASTSSEQSEVVAFQLQPAPNFARTCEHYKRKGCSNFFFSCCNTIDPCHRCHIERGCCDVLPPQITSIVCNVCSTRQSPSKACQNQACLKYEVPFSRSFCGICLVWSQAEITHCAKCGTCRVGSASELFHCEKCDVCYLKSPSSASSITTGGGETAAAVAAEVEDHHPNCVKSSLKDQICPVCLESVHTSSTPQHCVVVRCGHAMHHGCLKDVVKYSDPSMPPRCPTCRKCLLTPTQSKPYWDAIRVSISNQSPLQNNNSIDHQRVPMIREGDEVLSPFGRFIVMNIFSKPILPPAPVPAAILIDTNEEDPAAATAVASGGRGTIICYEEQDNDGDSDGSGHFLYPSDPPLPYHQYDMISIHQGSVGEVEVIMSPQIASQLAQLPPIELCRGILPAYDNYEMTIPLQFLRKDDNDDDDEDDQLECCSFVDIFCHDCEVKSAASFHWLGLECGHCGGFNTVRA